MHTAPPKHMPPRLATRLLRRWVVPHRLDEIEDDLAELFHLQVEQIGLRKAQGLYWRDVLSICARRSFRRQHPKETYSYETARGPIMLANYLKIALRNLRKQKGYTFINVAGLAVGMACCLLIVLYVQDELRYEQHHEQADRIFRLTASYTQGNHWAPIGPPIGPAVLNEIPEVENIARFFAFENAIVFHHEDRQLEVPNVVYADSTVFDVFTLPLEQGTPATALNRPNTIVISQSVAQKFFGNAEALGRTLTIPGWGDFMVTGVMQDLPPTTHLPIELMISMQTFYENQDGWLDRALTWAGFYTYLLLREPHQAEVMPEKLAAFVPGFYSDRFEAPANEVVSLVLQPLPDIHLHSHLEKEYRANSDVIYVYVFSVIALFVLLIACINFVNLATARATQRMREVGVRKTLGARRTQLVRQFLGESTLLVGLALVLAAGLILVLLPAFNQLAGKTLTFADIAQPLLLLSLLAMAIFTGLVSGLYPAFILSKFQPTEALRGLGDRLSQPALLRKGLVVLQFTISIFLIAGTLTVFNQLTYFRTKQLGFDKEQVISVHLSGELQESAEDNLETFKQSFLQNPSILNVSLASDVPGKRYSLEPMTLDGRQDEEGTMVRIAWGVDHDYLAALGIDLVAGRDFSQEAPADTSAWIINEAAAKRLALTEPLGQVMRWGDRYAGPIVGVVKDFHFASLHNEIEPLVIPLRPREGGTLLVRAQAGDMPDVLAFVEATLDDLVPDQLFRYSFVGDEFDLLYRNEDTLSQVFRYFAAIAILIACLGLFGLAAFTAEQRTKEIGVRKVLGASTPNIILLLSSEFTRLVLIAFMIAAPLAYFAMKTWLQAFAYRVDLGLGVFLLAGGAAFGIALLTVSYQSIKAALTDPVNALRYE